jgi:hypothetical protein
MDCVKHTPALVCEVMIDDDNENIVLDQNHSDYMWISKNSTNYHEYLQEVLTMAGLEY